MANSIQQAEAEAKRQSLAARGYVPAVSPRGVVGRYNYPYATPRTQTYLPPRSAQPASFGGGGGGGGGSQNSAPPVPLTGWGNPGTNGIGEAPGQNSTGTGSTVTYNPDGSVTQGNTVSTPPDPNVASGQIVGGNSGGAGGSEGYVPGPNGTMVPESTGTMNLPSSDNLPNPESVTPNMAAPSATTPDSGNGGGNGGDAPYGYVSNANTAQYLPPTQQNPEGTLANPNTIPGMPIDPSLPYQSDPSLYGPYFAQGDPNNNPNAPTVPTTESPDNGGFLTPFSSPAAAHGVMSGTTGSPDEAGAAQPGQEGGAVPPIVSVSDQQGMSAGPAAALPSGSTLNDLANANPGIPLSQLNSMYGDGQDPSAGTDMGSLIAANPGMKMTDLNQLADPQGLSAGPTGVLPSGSSFNDLANANPGMKMTQLDAIYGDGQDPSTGQNMGNLAAANPGMPLSQVNQLADQQMADQQAQGDPGPIAAMPGATGAGGEAGNGGPDESLIGSPFGESGWGGNSVFDTEFGVYGQGSYAPEQYGPAGGQEAGGIDALMGNTPEISAGAGSVFNGPPTSGGQEVGDIASGFLGGGGEAGSAGEAGGGAVGDTGGAAASDGGGGDGGGGDE